MHTANVGMVIVVLLFHVVVIIFFFHRFFPPPHTWQTFYQAATGNSATLLMPPAHGIIDSAEFFLAFVSFLFGALHLCLSMDGTSYRLSFVVSWSVTGFECRATHVQMARQTTNTLYEHWTMNMWVACEFAIRTVHCISDGVRNGSTQNISNCLENMKWHTYISIVRIAGNAPFILNCIHRFVALHFVTKQPKWIHEQTWFQRSVAQKMEFRALFLFPGRINRILPIWYSDFP